MTSSEKIYHEWSDNFTQVHSTSIISFIFMSDVLLLLSTILYDLRVT